MLLVKHLFDRVKADDGMRLWVEPIGPTKDLQAWCDVNRVMAHLGPPHDLWNWFVAHPKGYEAFRVRYHEWLSRADCLSALRSLASESQDTNVTLLHAGDDPEHNCATALGAFITELQAYNAR
jgi:uncharacterized protein YeaO (DUF488 family)